MWRGWDWHARIGSWDSNQEVVKIADSSEGIRTNGCVVCVIDREIKRYGIQRCG